jgi:hypothetical protein
MKRETITSLDLIRCRHDFSALVCPLLLPKN